MIRAAAALFLAAAVVSVSLASGTYRSAAQIAGVAGVLLLFTAVALGRSALVAPAIGLAGVAVVVAAPPAPVLVLCAALLYGAAECGWWAIELRGGFAEARPRTRQRLRGIAAVAVGGSAAAAMLLAAAARAVGTRTPAVSVVGAAAAALLVVGFALLARSAQRSP